MMLRFALVMGACAEVINIPVTTTELTALITHVKVGQPFQLIPFSLSFNSKSSFIYPLDNCQQFVSCFDSKLSATYYWDGTNREIDFQGLMSGVAVSDEIRFGQEAPVEEDFASISYIPQSQLTARDAAGELSFGPAGQVLKGAILEVLVDNPSRGIGSKNSRVVPSWKIRMHLGEYPAIPPGCITETFRVRAGRLSWQTPAQFIIGDSVVLNHTQVLFAPNIDDIVIPKRHYEAITEHILSDTHRFLNGPDGRLYAECLPGSVSANTATLSPIRIKSISPHSKFISILPEHLGYYGKQNYDSVKVQDTHRFCPTRVVFESGEFPIKLGLPFFASVQSVIFDEPSHEVKVSFVRNRLQRSSPTIVSLTTPIAPPRIVEYDAEAVIAYSPSGHLTMEFTSGWVSTVRPVYTLILTSPAARTSEDDGEMHVEFIFVKKFKSVSGPLAIARALPFLPTDFPGLYHMSVRRGVFGSPRPSESTVSFSFEKATDPDAQTFRIQILDNPTNVVIRLTRVDTIVELHNYNISAPVVMHQSDCSGERKCTICLVEFEDGDMVQNLAPHCQHEYHVGCIGPWLEKNRVCCLCRTKIPFRPDVDSVVGVAGPVPDEEGEADDIGESDD